MPFRKDGVLVTKGCRKEKQNCDKDFRKYLIPDTMGLPRGGWMPLYILEKV